MVRSSRISRKSIDPKFQSLAQRIVNRGYNLQRNVNKLVEETFLHVASSTINANPLWSGQSRLNWTASIGAKRPAARFVNVPRTNARVRGGKFSGGAQGHRGQIQVDQSIADSAAPVAMAAVREVASGYLSQVPTPNRSLPKAGLRKVRFKKSPKLRLSNSLKYVGKLWSGSWPSNPRTLGDMVDDGGEYFDTRAGNLLSKR